MRQMRRGSELSWLGWGGVGAGQEEGEGDKWDGEEECERGRGN